MVASNLRCIVVEVPANQEEDVVVRRARARDLLPWADPYIARLIRNLQDEVRSERAAARAEAAAQADTVADGSPEFSSPDVSPATDGFRRPPQAEAPPPLVGTPVPLDPTHDDLWPRGPQWDDG